jgi:hypothetical protein
MQYSVYMGNACIRAYGDSLIKVILAGKVTRVSHKPCKWNILFTYLYVHRTPVCFNVFLFHKSNKIMFKCYFYSYLRNDKNCSCKLAIDCFIITNKYYKILLYLHCSLIIYYYCSYYYYLKKMEGQKY